MYSSLLLGIQPKKEDNWIISFAGEITFSMVYQAFPPFCAAKEH